MIRWPFWKCCLIRDSEFKHTFLVRDVSQMTISLEKDNPSYFFNQLLPPRSVAQTPGQLPFWAESFSFHFPRKQRTRIVSLISQSPVRGHALWGLILFQPLPLGSQKKWLWTPRRMSTCFSDCPNVNTLIPGFRRGSPSTQNGQALLMGQPCWIS